MYIYTCKCECTFMSYSMYANLSVFPISLTPTYMCAYEDITLHVKAL